MKQAKKINQEEVKRQHVIRELNKMGIYEMASGDKLHNSTYQELKYFYSVETSKRG